jgi:hypothetical protein
MTPAPDDGVSSAAKGTGSKWANGAPSRRGGRHLRIIEEVVCSDGQYAIIRCSDNAVVVYRYANAPVIVIIIIHVDLFQFG